MLMGVGALYKAGPRRMDDLQTYQAASGGGAQHMRELLTQYGTLNESVRGACWRPGTAPFSISIATSSTRSARSAADNRRPISACRWVAALIPWIDKDLGNGMSREEWKGMAETNKILGNRGGDPGRWFLRACRCDALPQPGADLQAEEGRTAVRHRSPDRARTMPGSRSCPTPPRPRCANSRPWR